MRTITKRIGLLIALTNAVCMTGVTAAEAFREGFQSPPLSARPELFWDWMLDLVTATRDR